VLDVVAFRKELGDGSDLEYLRNALNRHLECPSVDAAVRTLRLIVQSLLDEERYADAAVLLWGPELFDPRPASVRIILKAIQEGHKIILLGAAGQSKTYTPAARLLLDWLRDPEYTSVKIISTTAGHAKCFGRGTRVRMYNGNVKEIQDIKAGDVVMGPDSKPRRVLETTSGREKMYDVKAQRGPGFVCNASHLLYLENTIDDPSRWKKLGKAAILSVSDYVQKSTSFKREYKMVRQGFELEPVWQLFDPYIVGLWLGDGHTNAPALTNMDQRIVDEWCYFFERSGYRIKKYSNGSKANTYFAFFGEQGHREVKNPFRSFLREECLENGEKRIPRRILRSSANHRWAVLAGILDTDGALNQGGFCLTIKSKPLARDVLELCHSLGLHANQREVKRKSQRGTEGTYQTLCIRGKFICLPTLVKKTHQVGTRQRYVPFKVQELPEDDYFGFCVGGDELFLLDNGLVVHNSNVFSTLQRLHKWSGSGGASIIPLEGEAQEGFIGLDPKMRYGSMEKVSIKIGENGGGALQGFHPQPRRSAHPQFGAFSRLRVLLDEAEEIPIGVWSGLANTMTNIHGKEILKVICSANPKRTSSVLAMNSEPPQGWGDVDIDEDLAWKSREGWDVYRLDAARSENVTSGKVIYVNFMTREGYDELRLKKGGNTPEYHSFARGMYPMAGVERSLIPMKILNGARGTLIFSGFTVTCGGCDPAFQGDDEMVMFSGRFGLATGFRDLQDNVINFERPRWTLQIDQHYSMPKNLTLTQAGEVKKYCVGLGIKPDWFAIDQTGTSTGISEVLIETWSPKIIGVTFGGVASGKKLLDESIRKATEEFATIDTEMYAAFCAWAEYGYLKIGPRVDTFKLFPQLSGRQYDVVGRGKKEGKPLLRIEEKKSFKHRLGESPDYGDAACLLLHAARVNGQEKASAVQKERRRPEQIQSMEGDSPTWLNFNEGNEAA
jgi:hypothetical protein